MMEEYSSLTSDQLLDQAVNVQAESSILLQTLVRRLQIERKNQDVDNARLLNENATLKRLVKKTEAELQALELEATSKIEDLSRQLHPGGSWKYVWDQQQRTTGWDDGGDDLLDSDSSDEDWEQSNAGSSSGSGSEVDGATSKLFALQRNEEDDEEEDTDDDYDELLHLVLDPTQKQLLSEMIAVASEEVREVARGIVAGDSDEPRDDEVSFLLLLRTFLLHLHRFFRWLNQIQKLTRYICYA